MKKKNNNNYLFWIPLLILFIMYIGYSMSLESGYYQSKIARKTILTEEKIEEFEKDIQEGNELDLKDYTVENYHDYSSPMSKAGQQISLSVENFITKGLGEFVAVVSKLFTWYNFYEKMW